MSSEAVAKPVLTCVVVMVLLILELDLNKGTTRRHAMSVFGSVSKRWKLRPLKLFRSMMTYDAVTEAW